MSEPRYAISDFNEIPTTHTSNGRVERDSWLPLNLADLPAQPPIKPTLGGFGLVYKGKRHVFSGPQESAKTLAAYAIGLETIRTHPDSTIALVDFEMGAYAARNRLQDLGAEPHELERIHYLEPHQPANDERISLLIGLNPLLVIIDAAAGAYDLQGLDDNSRRDVERFANLYVRGFWQHGIATIILDHVVKNTETRGKYAIGSERKTGGTDVHLGFDTILPIKRGAKGLYKITTHKDRDGYLKRGTLAELELESDPDSHRISWTFTPTLEADDEHPWLPTKVMEKVSTLLQLQSEPISRNATVQLAGGKREVALAAIDHLVRLGYVTETPGPNRTKLLETTSPFTVRDWETEQTLQVVPGGSQVVPGTTSMSVVPSPRRGEVPEPLAPTENNQVVPEPQATFGDWIDDLSANENGDPPGDLHDPAGPDADLPL